MRKTAFGLPVYAVGGNEEAVARLFGIATSRGKVMVYSLRGALAALTGFCLASRLGVGDPLVGQGME